MGNPERPQPLPVGDDCAAVDADNDVAVIRLPSNTIPLLSHKRFLELSDVAFDVEIDDWYCVLFGYLWEGSKPSRDFSQLLLHNYRYWTRQYQGRISADSYDKSRHLLVEYHQSSWSMPDGVQVANPSSLGGISGSSLWRIFQPHHVEDGWSDRLAKVVGVENVVYNNRIIRCTRWKEVLPLLKNLEPSLFGRFRNNC